MDFRKKRFFTLRLTACPLNTGAKYITALYELTLAPLTPIVHWLLKGGNTTLNYPNIQFLHKLGE